MPTALMLALSASMVLPGAALAKDWTGAADNNWFDPANWANPGGVPVAGDGVFVQSGGTTIVDGVVANGTSASVSVVNVGDTSSGTVQIRNGGVLDMVLGSLGTTAFGQGTVLVDGANSEWNMTGELRVGVGGIGILTISGGGAVTNAQGLVGFSAGSTGTVNVDGANGQSTWTSTALQVGVDGTGTVNASNSGVIQTLGLLLGVNGTGDGAMNVDASFLISTDVMVGESGKGTLAVSNGGEVLSQDVFVGRLQGGVGVVNLSSGAFWSNDGLRIGGAGNGTVNITGNSTVNTGANGVVIGIAPTGVGLVTVDAGTWNNAGDLTVGKLGSGTLNILGGGSVNNILGAVGVQPNSIGRVHVNGPGSTWNNTSVVVGNGGIGALTISNGGTVTSQNGVIIASAPSSSGELNIGSPLALGAAGPGTLTSLGGVQFGSGNGSLNFNHSDTSGNYVFGADISGPMGLGIITHKAGFTNLTGNSAGFTGQTNLNGGRLAVNGTLGSMVNVSTGGILGGSGSVGTLLVNPTGVVAPGNSIGTLTVNGSATFLANSIFRVEADAAGNADKLAITGAATLNGGTVEVLALMPGNYAASTSYTLLTAGGGITGAFAGVVDDSAFLDAALSHGANNVDLTLTRNDIPFGGVGQSLGQTSTGTSAETLGPGNPIYDALVVLSASQARAAFDQLSGEVHASARSVQLEDSHFVRDASLERLRAMDSERVANDGGADAGEGKQARLLPSVRDLAYWGRAMGSWGHMAGEGNAATVKRDAAGFLMGADTRFGEEGRFGLMGGYSRSAFDVADRNSAGSSDNYHLGAYAGNRWGDLALRTGLSYSWHDVSTSRSVAFPGFTDSLKADYKAATTQAFAELAYRIKTARAELEPFVNLAHVNVSSDAFTERGGPAALASAGNNSGVTFSTLGLRASTKVSMSGGVDVTARGMLGYRHAFGDTAPSSNMAFAGGLPFAITGAPIAKGAAVVEAGLDFKLTNAATLGFSYGGQFGSGLKEQTAKVNLNLAF